LFFFLIHGSWPCQHAASSPTHGFINRRHPDPSSPFTILIKLITVYSCKYIVVRVRISHRCTTFPIFQKFYTSVQFHGNSFYIVAGFHILTDIMFSSLSSGVTKGMKSLGLSSDSVRVSSLHLASSTDRCLS
jgi:hypothetical protein